MIQHAQQLQEFAQRLREVEALESYAPRSHLGCFGPITAVRHDAVLLLSLRARSLMKIYEKQ